MTGNELMAWCVQSAVLARGTSEANIHPVRVSQ
jgi:hypothetical protein